jgi:hypothetical protein
MNLHDNFRPKGAKRRSVRLYYSAFSEDGTARLCKSLQKACFNAILTAFYTSLCDFAGILCRFCEIALNHAKIAVKPMMDLDGFAPKSGKKMDFPPKLWIFPVAFARKCAIMIESFEAGNTTVSTVFPIFLTSGGAVSKFGFGYFAMLRSGVRLPFAPME